MGENSAGTIVMFVVVMAATAGAASYFLIDTTPKPPPDPKPVASSDKAPPVPVPPVTLPEDEPTPAVKAMQWKVRYEKDLKELAATPYRKGSSSRRGKILPVSIESNAKTKVKSYGCYEPIFSRLPAPAIAGKPEEVEVLVLVHVTWEEMGKYIGTLSATGYAERTKVVIVDVAGKVAMAEKSFKAPSPPSKITRIEQAKSPVDPKAMIEFVQPYCP